MKITNVEAVVVGASWRPWVFVRVDTDAGITGWGECSDGKNPWGVAGAVQDAEPLLVGQDPRPYEMRHWDLLRGSRQSPGGIAAKAIAGIELALVDIKARALGISVTELFGGPTREDVRLYWSHCSTTRALYADVLGVAPLRSMTDIADLGREVVERGYSALKTNIVFPGEPATTYFPGFTGGPGTLDGTLSKQMLRHIVELVGTFREAVGDDVDIALDLNFNFRPAAVTAIARELEPLELMWLEVDMYEPDALRAVRESTATPICTGENLFYQRDYLPYFERRAADVFMVDVPWNGFSQSKKIGDLAAVYEFNVAPHNYYSHLSSFISASLCAVLPNVHIQEIDVDDVPWKDELVTELPPVRDGRMAVPTGPGWGTELVWEATAAHPWVGKSYL